MHIRIFSPLTLLLRELWLRQIFLWIVLKIKRLVLFNTNFFWMCISGFRCLQSSVQKGIEYILQIQLLPIFFTIQFGKKEPYCSLSSSRLFPQGFTVLEKWKKDNSWDRFLTCQTWIWSNYLTLIMQCR